MCGFSEKKVEEFFPSLPVQKNYANRADFHFLRIVLLYF